MYGGLNSVKSQTAETIYFGVEVITFKKEKCEIFGQIVQFINKNTYSRRRTFARSRELLFVAKVVSRSFDTFVTYYPLLKLTTV